MHWFYWSIVGFNSFAFNYIVLCNQLRVVRIGFFFFHIFVWWWNWSHKQLHSKNACERKIRGKLINLLRVQTADKGTYHASISKEYDGDQKERVESKSSIARVFISNDFSSLLIWNTFFFWMALVRCRSLIRQEKWKF